MIYVTGDCHGDYRRFSTDNFPEQKEMTGEDYVIVCGDFGYWDASQEQKWWRKWLSEKPFTLLWVDGNHENYDMLSQLPVESWKGGKIQRVEKNVFHLMRGQIYEIDGRTIFSFGGARSHDIQDGILEPDAPDYREKYKRLQQKRALFRVNHISWWKEEMPDKEQMEEGRKNLSAAGWKVDYMITHCASTSVQALVGRGFYKPDMLTDYLEEIRQKCRYKRWFFGHYHDNQNVTEKDLLLYEQILRIA